MDWVEENYGFSPIPYVFNVNLYDYAWWRPRNSDAFGGNNWNNLENEGRQRTERMGSYFLGNSEECLGNYRDKQGDGIFY